MTVIAVNLFAASSTRQLKSTETEQSGGKLDKAEETGISSHPINRQD